MFTMTMQRRTFLRGLGGAMVAAPWLHSVLARPSRAAGEPVVGLPRRLIVMFTHYGCLTDRWFPANSHGPLTAGDLEGTTLDVLAPHVGQLLLPRGLRMMNQWSADMSTGQGNDPHTQVVGSYFTCMPVDPHVSDPFDLSNDAKFTATPIGPSLDHVCAQQLHTDGEPLFLRVSNRNESAQSAISYSAGKTPYSGLGTPAQALSAMTGLLQEGPLTADSYQLLRGKGILDLVRADLETLERKDMSRSDRDKLSKWKDLLSDVTPQLREQCTQQTAQALGIGDLADTAQLTDQVSDGMDRADMYSNVAVLSALCDFKRVIFLKYPPSYQFEGLGVNNESMSVSHRVDSGVCSAHSNEQVQLIDQYYARKFAYLVNQLQQFDEGEGTLLDNSAAVWFQEMSDGAAHNLNNMPIVQAGSCGGYFKTGWAVNVDDGTSDLHRGYSSGCDPTVTTTGTPAEVGNAPINKYYCNLMNAMGVRAGEDGFPLKGGTREVSCYGMYDRTEDFVSGGALPAFISDPGEFSDLKV